MQGKRTDPEIKRRIIEEIVLTNAPWLAIAKKYGVTYGTIRNWRQEIDKRKAEVAAGPKSAPAPTTPAAALPLPPRVSAPAPVRPVARQDDKDSEIRRLKDVIVNLAEQLSRRGPLTTI